MEKFIKTSQETQRIFDLTIAGIACEKRKMFGYPSAFIGGNLFCGTFEERVFVRLPEEDRLALVGKSENIRIFEPIGGRPMREYVEIDVAGADTELVHRLVRKAAAYAASLPEKSKKP